MRHFLLSDIATLLHYEANLPLIELKGYCCDSRLVKEGDLFFALPGEKTDGHAYIDEVEKRGAAACVVSKSYAKTHSLPLLAVDDPLAALQKIAAHAISKSTCRIVAITGSVGKTTTKEFVKTLLSTRYKTAASPGNSNSQIGLPLSILNHTTGDEEILVLEMGMTNEGEISRLIAIAPPDVAVLTTAALVHACNFESIEHIARTKGEIFKSPKTALGIIHKDLSNFCQVCAIGSCKKISFSEVDSSADYSLIPGPEFTVHSKRENKTVVLGNFPIPGKHNRQNFLIAIAVARYFDVSWEEIKAALPLLALPERRLSIVQRGGITFINDSYNACEISVKAALENLPEPQAGGRKIAVLGSMLELGNFSERCHRQVGEHALNYVEQLFCLGAECQPICEIWNEQGKPARLFQSRQELSHALKKELKQEDVVLIKGSRSKELWKLLEDF